MGDPRKFKSKYSGPGHPWQRVRIEEEGILMREYGLKTKRELWKVQSKVKSFAGQAKRLIALRTVQADREKKQLLERLSRIGLLKTGAILDDVLGLTTKHLLDRRLQTLVFKKGYAHTPVQARQYIVHGHVLVGQKKISAPSYVVPVSEEAQISFVVNSSLASAEHPERLLKPKAPRPMVKEQRRERRR